MQGSIDFSGVLSGAISGEGGGGSVPVVTANATVDANIGTPSCDVVRSGSDENPNFTFNFKNIKGETGASGQNGQNGVNGADGFSPAVNITNISNGKRISITDATHPSGQVFDIYNGTDGTDGTDGTNGTNGVSPVVTIENIPNGHAVNITDATHPSGQTFNVMNGDKGDTGETGATGPVGPGLPSGGSIGQIIYKSSLDDYHTEWGNIPSYTATSIYYDADGKAYITDDDVQGALDDVDDALTTINSNLAQKINIAILTTPLEMSYADTSSLGYRTTETTKVDISTLSGFPTGKTYVGAVAQAMDIYGSVVYIDASKYLRGARKISGTVDVRIYVFYY